MAIPRATRAVLDQRRRGALRLIDLLLALWLAAIALGFAAAAWRRSDAIEWVEGVAMSGDGRIVAVCLKRRVDDDYAIAFLDATTGQRVGAACELPGRTPWTRMTLSHDGGLCSFVASTVSSRTGGAGDEWLAWDVRKGDWRWPPLAVSAFSGNRVSTDGQWASVDGTTCDVLHTRGRQPPAPLGQCNPMHGFRDVLAFSDDCDTVAMMSQHLHEESTRVELLALPGLEVIHQFDIPARWSWTSDAHAALSADNQTLALLVGASVGPTPEWRVELWNPQTGERLAASEPSMSFRAALGDNGRRLAVIPDWGTLLWDSSTPLYIHEGGAWQSIVINDRIPTDVAAAAASERIAIVADGIWILDDARAAPRRLWSVRESRYGWSTAALGAGLVAWAAVWWTARRRRLIGANA